MYPNAYGLWYKIISYSQQKFSDAIKNLGVLPLIAPIFVAQKREKET